jgi:hypothetical protein
MTTTRAVGDLADQVPGRLVSRPLLIRFVSIAGPTTSFYLLLSAVPLYARSAGASPGTAGLTTTAAAWAASIGVSMTHNLERYQMKRQLIEK